MVAVNELRKKLRQIRKQLADGVGYGDFKYLHKKKKPELEELLKKYEKYDKSANVIQSAIKNKRARNEAQRLLNKRDDRQILRDLEMRLSAINRPQTAPAVITGNIATSSSRKRGSLSNMYDAPLTPFSTFQLFDAPVPSVSEIVPDEQFFKKRSVAQGRVVPLPRVPKTQRPQTTSLKALQLRQRLNLTERASTASPNLPALQLRQKLKTGDRPLSSNNIGRTSALQRVQVKPRPESASRTFNRFSPL